MSKEISPHLQASLARLVFGSNFIESAGSDLETTQTGCASVFRGGSSAEFITCEVTEDAYAAQLDQLARTHRPTTAEEVVKSRREVVQHAEALLYMIGEVIHHVKPWTEQQILETHRILCDGIESEDHVVPGAYRTHEVAIRYGNSTKAAKPGIRHVVVQRYMAEMIENLNHLESMGSMNPYELAAKFHHQFVNIHPFADGNGRVARIILNVLLLKHTGHVVELGFGGEEARQRYLETTTRCSKIFREEDMEVDFSDHKGHLPLATLIKEESGVQEKKPRT